MSPKSGGIDRAVGWRHFVYGGAASCIAEIGTFPLDTTKTRLQIQGQQSKHLVSGGVSPIRKLYSGMLDALVRIPKEEGIKALYRGISPALLRQSIYGTLKFGFYYSFKKVVPEEHVASNILCAVVAGIVSSAIANPTDVLKVRMQVATSSTSGSSLFSSFHKIYKYEGLGGLWRGVGPTSQRAGIIAAVELPVYDGCKKYFIDMNIFDDSPPNHVVSSFIASFTAVIASTPIDVIRTRLMSQKLQRHSVHVGNPPGEASYPLTAALENTNPRTNLANITAVTLNGNEARLGSTLSSNDPKSKIYKSSWDCFRITLKHEGVRALYKGFIPAWLRMGPWNLIFFTSYEQLLRLY